MKFLKDKSILEITETNPEDAAEILEYLKKVGSESDNLTFDGEGIGLSLEQEKAYLEKNLKAFNNKSFSAKVKGQIVSVSGIQGSQRERTNHNVSLGLSVLKDFWNIGVATHVLQYILNYCRMTKEIENVTLEVREDNEFAVKLYEKHGFKKIGKYTNKFRVSEKYYDILIMELVLKK